MKTEASLKLIGKLYHLQVTSTSLDKVAQEKQQRSSESDQQHATQGGRKRNCVRASKLPGNTTLKKLSEFGVLPEPRRLGGATEGGYY